MITCCRRDSNHPYAAGVFSVDEMLPSEHYGATGHFNTRASIEKESDLQEPRVERKKPETA